MAVLATDAFTRANGQLGANWTVNNASSADGPLIVSNHISSVSGQTRMARYTAVSAPANQYAQLVFNANDCGPGVRFGGTANASCDGYVYEGDTTNATFQRYDDGSNTVIQTLTATTAGQTMRAVILGAILRGYINGAQSGTNQTDATYATGDPGVEAFGNTSSGDDFEMGSVPANTRAFPLGMEIGMHRRMNA